MTGHDDFDRTLAGWFEADAKGELQKILDSIVFEGRPSVPSHK